MTNTPQLLRLKLFDDMQLLKNYRLHSLRAGILVLICSLFIFKVKAQEDQTSPASTGSVVPARLHYLEVPVAVELGLEPQLPVVSGTIFIENPESDAVFVSRMNNIQQYSAAVESIEGQGGAWDSNLAEQLATIGDLEQQQGNHLGAIVAFSRAVHINKIANGLYTLEQIPLLEKMIESYAATDNWEQADLYNNHLFFLEHKVYGNADPRIISALERLAAWNMEAFSIGFGDALGVRLSSAQILFNAAIRMVIVHFGESDQRLPNYLRGLASSAYQVAMHPEYAVEVGQTEFRYKQESLRRKLNEGTSIIPSSFLMGEAALLAIVDYHTRKADDVYAIAEAITHLGDWYLLFDGKRRQAEDSYLEAWELLRAEENGEDLVQQLFGQVVPLPTFVVAPKNLEMRSSDTKIRSGMENSIADVSFAITASGTVRDIELLTEETGENSRRISRLLRDVRMSRFRPILEEGRPVRSDGHVFRYRYWY